MLKRVLSGKNDGANPDYDKAGFEQALSERFQVNWAELVSDARTGFEAQPDR